jgi:predicted PurR-regulated permease PerM/phosphoglycolate phosphatase-like HAD superfamily hydrolase
LSTRWSPSFKLLVTVAVLIAGTWLLFRARVVLTPLILALLLAFLASYPANWLTRRTGWPRGLSATIVLLLALLLVAALSVLVVPWLVSLLRSFGTTLVSVIQQLLEVTPKPIAITPTLTVDLGRYYAPVNEWLRGLLSLDLNTLQDLQRLFFPFASGAAVVVIGAASGALWLLFILIVSFYVITDAHLMYWSVVAIIPEVWRPELRMLWRELVDIWDAFIRGRLLLSLVMGFLIWAALSILGVRNAPALGVLYGILSFVPGVGPVIAAIPGVLIALILGSSWLPLPNLWFALLVTGTYVLLEQFENLYLLPRVVGRRVALHPGAVIVGAVVGAELAGVLGILLAAPVMASLRVLLTYVLRKLFDEGPIPTVEGIPHRELLWRDVVREQEVRGVFFDLDGTLVETDEQRVQELAGRLRPLRRVLSDQERLRVARRWLMRGEIVVNRAITWLDRMHLDNLIFRMDDRLRRWRGIVKPEQFTAVAGSIEGLRVLAQKGFSLGVVTSRARKDAEAYLAQYHLDGLFDTVITRDEVKRLKPHPLPVRLAAQELGLAPSQCVLVGDTGVDVRSAKAAGALAVGVLCGFGERNDFDEADLVLESPSQLVEWL